MMNTLAAIIGSEQLSNTHSNLQDLAESLIRQRGLPAIDRLARRKKPGLICWFCENCPDLLHNPYSCPSPCSSICHSLRSGQARNTGVPNQAELSPVSPHAEACPSIPPTQDMNRGTNMLLGYSVDDLISDLFAGTM
jgi:hypothetical protein